MDTIDGHAHFFNLKYLPVAGIIVRYITEYDKIKLEKEKILPIAKMFEKILIQFTSSDFENKKKYDNDTQDYLDSPLYLLQGYTEFKPIQSSMLNKISYQYYITDEEFVDNICLQLCANDIMNDDVSNAILAFNDISGNKLEFQIPIENKMELTKDELINLVISRVSKVKIIIEWVLKQLDKIIGFGHHASWFRFMMHSESEIAKRLYEKDEVGIKTFINLTMDVDYYFKYDNTTRLSYFEFQTQIQNMKKLQMNLTNQNKTLYNFVAFDPSRQDCMEIIQKAIEDNGFVGVKYYPPMGYKPFYNNPQDTEEKLISIRNNLLFDYCSKKHIPIFSHTNNGGFEAHLKQSGVNSNPKYWIPVLDIYPDLILNLSHAGGEYGWFSPNSDEDIIDPNLINPDKVEDNPEIQEKNWNFSYAAVVYKLCVLKDNVYCDFAYFDDLVDDMGNPIHDKATILKTRLLKLFSKSEKFQNKIFYGSDWHMLFREGKNALYYNAYKDFISETEFGSFRDKFFIENVKKYLNVADVLPSVHT